MDDTELLAAIGRIVVNGAVLEYAVAELVAATEGMRDAEGRRHRAVEIVRVTGRPCAFSDVSLSSARIGPSTG